MSKVSRLNKRLSSKKILTKGVGLMPYENWMDEEDKKDTDKLNALTLVTDGDSTHHNYLVIDRDFIMSNISKKDVNLLVGASMLFHKVDAKRGISDGFDIFWSILTNIVEAIREKERQKKESLSSKK